jgi:hypothetical protein
MMLVIKHSETDLQAEYFVGRTFVHKNVGCGCRKWACQFAEYPI